VPKNGFFDGRGWFTVHLGDRNGMADNNRGGKEEHRDDAFQMWKFKLTLQITSTMEWRN
jgi:hypothetical protein